MKPTETGTKILSENPIEGWKRCELEIIGREPNAQDYELEIRLSTGRQHQIRAQLSFIGNPIIGDGEYGRASDIDLPLRLKSNHLSFRDLDNTLRHYDSDLRK